MKPRAELEWLMARLRSGEALSSEDRERGAEIVERLIAGLSKHGRKPTPLVEKVQQRVRLAAHSEAIYSGAFRCPGRELELKLAKGDREEADALAGDLLGASSSVVGKSRAWRRTFRGEFDLHKAVLILYATDDDTGLAALLNL